jgi:hypothetical protein
MIGEVGPPRRGRSLFTFPLFALRAQRGPALRGWRLRRFQRRFHDADREFF